MPSQPYLPTYNVTTYGATGNGTTDDRAAIQATINAAAATGGIVLFPAGTYLVTIRGPLTGEDAWPRAFTIAPNITFQGASSATTTIKLANNQVPYGALMMPATYDGDVSGFSMFDLTVDSNALNNPLYSAADDAQSNFDLKRPRIAVQIMTGSNTTIQRCVFTNVIGVWALNFYSYYVSNFLIDSCSFTNIGGGTLNFDSSTINFAGNGATITNNKFYAANYNASNVYTLGARTAIEVHDTNVTVANNQIYGFPVGIIMGGDSPTGSNGLIVKNNTIYSAYNGIQFWPEMGNNSAALAMQNCTISGNTITLDVNAWQPLGGVAGAYANGIVLIYIPDNGQIQNLLIQNNSITFTNYTPAGTRSINVDYNSAGILFDRSTGTDNGPLNTNVQVTGNTISHALGDGIQFQSNQVSLVISSNIIIDPADSPFFTDPSFWSGWQSAIMLDGSLAGAQVIGNQYIDNRSSVQTQAGLWWQADNTGNCVYYNNTTNVPLPNGLLFNAGGTGTWVTYSVLQPAWLLGNPVPLSDGLKDLQGDFLLSVYDYSVFSASPGGYGFRQNQHFQLAIIDQSIIATNLHLGQRFNLIVVDASTISSVNAGGFIIGLAIRFQLWITDTSFFLVTFKSVRFQLYIVDTTIVYYRLSMYVPATANTNFAGDTFIDAIPDSLNFDPQVRSIGLVNDTSVATLTPLADRVRVICDIMQQEEHTLDLLAFQYGVLFYQGANLVVDPLARTNLKKSLIQQSYGIHCKLGSPGIIQRIISQIYQPAILQEWWQYGGTHDHFRIYTLNNVNDPNVINSLSTALYSIIRASQTFDGFYGPLIPARILLYISVSVYCEMDMVITPAMAPKGYN